MFLPRIYIPQNDLQLQKKMSLFLGSSIKCCSIFNENKKWNDAITWDELFVMILNISPSLSHAIPVHSLNKQQPLKSLSFNSPDIIYGSIRIDRLTLVEQFDLEVGLDDCKWQPFHRNRLSPNDYRSCPFEIQNAPFQDRVESPAETISIENLQKKF